MSEWMKIDLFDAYEINRNGSIRNATTHKILKPTLNDYARVYLRKNSKTHTLYVHRLVALQFIPNPDSLPFVDHINRNKTDNRVENLRWASVSENGQNTNAFNISSFYTNGTEYFAFQKMINGEVHRKAFKTLDQAIHYRNCFLDSLLSS